MAKAIHASATNTRDLIDDMSPELDQLLARADLELVRRLKASNPNTIVSLRTDTTARIASGPGISSYPLRTGNTTSLDGSSAAAAGSAPQITTQTTAGLFGGPRQLQPAPFPGHRQLEPAPFPGYGQLQPAPVPGYRQLQPAPFPSYRQLQPAPVPGYSDEQSGGALGAGTGTPDGGSFHPFQLGPGEGGSRRNSYSGPAMSYTFPEGNGGGVDDAPNSASKLSTEANEPPAM
ncbi:hypothetical protein PVAG01_00984 [Phlyctema vagabunda]|uniref:Uncharacterized protein n=1 Tax=Phlyctema vagabunda TaxID=108571 RepID=A0ABR4PW51_9HELO